RFRRIVAALLAILGRLLAFELIEESELRASDMLHLLAETADAGEVAGCWYKRILVLGPRLGECQQTAFRILQRAGNAFGDGFRHLRLIRRFPGRPLARRLRICRGA